MLRGAMEWILVRHAEPRIARSAAEPVDPDLTERGRWQAERVSEWLSCEPIDAIVTSPKRRAKETVAPLASKLGLEPSVVEDLDEIDRHARVYAPFHLIPEHFPELVTAMERQDWETLGWDDPRHFAERVREAWEGLVADPPGERVVVACHGGVIGVIVGHVLGMGVGGGLGGPVATSPFAAMSRFRAAASGALQLVTLNEDAHFDGQREQRIGWEGAHHGFEDEEPS